jgi:hypothetical protein
MVRNVTGMVNDTGNDSYYDRNNRFRHNTYRWHRSTANSSSGVAPSGTGAPGRDGSGKIRLAAS